MSAVADVLNGAADLLLEDGWVQGDYRGPNGEHCMVDAIGAAIRTSAPGRPPWFSPKYAEATLAVRVVVGSSLLAAWQDQPGRTQAEVVAALRAAAEQAA